MPPYDSEVEAGDEERDAVTLVLVHGAWHGPWCWEEITQILDDREVGSSRAGTRAVEAFYDRCPPELAARAVERLRPMEAASTGAPCLATPWTDVPSTYVLCERDRAIPIEGQRSMAAHAANTVTLDTDHSPFLSMPAETAQLLIDIAHAV